MPRSRLRHRGLRDQVEAERFGGSDEGCEAAKFELLWNFEETYPKFQALEKALAEFRVYIERNAWMISNYGQLWREGKVISTAFIESLVNSLLGKRFTKKQQMQWTHAGAHLLLQTQTRVINGEPPATFRKWYPTYAAANEPCAAAA